eukprot:TRINITY_DN55776_c0_g1_i1.p1 TRINITY_DN55776_c0_g1~~TRINITY_DN55776_c0_g1_i1.p1  ORF type:complete len:610 (+),score=76.40 TRINITY_DN55776_c0_g1_i1:858-2687(+)
MALGLNFSCLVLYHTLASVHRFSHATNRTLRPVSKVTQVMEVIGSIFLFFPTTPLSALLFALLSSYAHSQPPSGSGADMSTMKPVQPDSFVFIARRQTTCNPRFRQLDGTCTNDYSEESKLWGSTNRPQFSYFKSLASKLPTGSLLKSPREISNILSSQTNETFDERGLNELTTFIGQFLDHTLASTPTNNDELMPITVPTGDHAGGLGKSLPFKRSVRVRDDKEGKIERPGNSLSSAVDLTNVYGPNQMRSNFLRAMRDGLMKTGPDDYLPPNTDFVNAPPDAGEKYFLAGDHRANEHPVLTAIHTIFLREHNSIARELKKEFPFMDDELLFQNAKKINEAQWQKIVFEEWYPSITGKSMPLYRGFDKAVNPTVSLLFSTAAFRVGHTMVGNRVNRRGSDNFFLKPFNLRSTFFRERSFFMRFGVEQFLRGALGNRAQKVDLLVVDALRNFLFSGIKGESDNFDLIALNLQRGRDHALPSYNTIRAMFGQTRAVSFEDISKSPVVQSKLQRVYDTPDEIEAWPGLMAEDHTSGSSFGPTLLAIWQREFLRLRDGDRLYFRNKGVFEPSLAKLERVKALMRGDDVLRAILLRNSKMVDVEFPRRTFFVN